MGGIVKMIKEVAPGIFRILVPLPMPDVGSMNSYVLMDKDRNLIIDPGMAHPDAVEAVEKGMEKLGLDRERTDFFVTHHHMDHFGAISRFMAETSVIYISRGEADFVEKIASGAVRAEMAHFLEIMGFPEKDPMKVAPEFLSDEYGARAAWPFRYITEGDIIEKGQYHFRFLVTPGHTAAHTCLYEPDRKILITGDHFTPGIQFVSERMNPVAEHLKSLDRLRAMEVNLVLPGHSSPFKDHKRRIDLLKLQHRERTEAAFNTLADGGRDAYEVAVSLQESLPDGQPWEQLPSILKFIYSRHSLAYLRYLEEEGRVRKELDGSRFLYFQNRFPRAHTRGT
jgi:glyoxylase-like metal-dependent hydrolase (beta-lactamase superfamily II)